MMLTIIAYLQFIAVGLFVTIWWMMNQSHTEMEVFLKFWWLIILSVILGSALVATDQT